VRKVREFRRVFLRRKVGDGDMRLNDDLQRLWTEYRWLNGVLSRIAENLRERAAQADRSELERERLLACALRVQKRLSEGPPAERSPGA
jgi:hypothetical protein